MRNLAPTWCLAHLCLPVSPSRFYYFPFPHLCPRRGGLPCLLYSLSLCRVISSSLYTVLKNYVYELRYRQVRKKNSRIPISGKSFRFWLIKNWKRIRALSFINRRQILISHVMSSRLYLNKILKLTLILKLILISKIINVKNKHVKKNVEI